MAYDENLADRVRDLLPPGDVVTERHMFCGVIRDTLMARLGPDAADSALDQPHVRQMDFTGRPMKGMVFIEPEGLLGPALAGWVSAAMAYARALPPKPVSSPARKRR